MPHTLDISRVAAARHREQDAGRATRNDALADLLVAHGARLTDAPAAREVTGTTAVPQG